MPYTIDASGKKTKFVSNNFNMFYNEDIQVAQTIVLQGANFRSNYTYENSRDFLDSLKANKVLTNIDLRNILTYGDMGYDIALALSEIKTLHTVYIDASSSGPFLQGLTRGNAPISNVWIQGSINSFDFAEITSILSRNTTIKKIGFTDVYLSSKDLMMLAEALESNTTLTSLHKSTYLALKTQAPDLMALIDSKLERNKALVDVVSEKAAAAPESTDAESSTPEATDVPAALVELLAADAPSSTPEATSCSDTLALGDDNQDFLEITFE